MARQQARLGACRLGAVRLGDYRPTVHLFVNSTNVSAAGAAFGWVEKDKLTLDERTGDVPSLLRFTLVDVASTPPPGAQVYLGLGSADHLIFRGQILKRPQKQKSIAQRPEFSVEVESNHRMMSRRLVFGTYQSRTADYIIKDLIARYTTGFTANHVQSGMDQIDEITFTNERVPRAIQRVCERVAAKWYPDAYNDIHAFTGEESGVSPAATLSATGKHWGWDHEPDISQVRTHVTVKGAGCTLNDTTPAVTTLLLTSDTSRMVGASTITAVNYYYEVRSITASAPYIIYIGDTPPRIGLQEVLYQGAAINLVAIATSVTLQNSIAALEGGDGIHEHYLADERLGPDGAMNRARAELALFGSIEQRGNYVTRDPSASAGRVITINVGSMTQISSVTARITKSSVSKFEESTRPWSATRTHLFPQRDIAYSSGQMKDLAELLANYERQGR